VVCCGSGTFVFHFYLFQASSLVGGIVKFGSLDCSVYRDLCASYDVRSYPTIIFYNYSTPHAYTGQFVSRDIATFVEDVLRPPGISEMFFCYALNRERIMNLKNVLYKTFRSG
jgi:hypothetical protein